LEDLERNLQPKKDLRKNRRSLLLGEDGLFKPKRGRKSSRKKNPSAFALRAVASTGKRSLVD